MNSPFNTVYPQPSPRQIYSRGYSEPAPQLLHPTALRPPSSIFIPNGAGIPDPYANRVLVEDEVVVNEIKQPGWIDGINNQKDKEFFKTMVCNTARFSKVVCNDVSTSFREDEENYFYGVRGYTTDCEVKKIVNAACSVRSEGIDEVYVDCNKKSIYYRIKKYPADDKKRAEEINVDESLLLDTKKIVNGDIIRKTYTDLAQPIRDVIHGVQKRDIGYCMSMTAKVNDNPTSTITVVLKGFTERINLYSLCRIYECKDVHSVMVNPEKLYVAVAFHNPLVQHKEKTPRTSRNTLRKNNDKQKTPRGDKKTKKRAYESSSGDEEEDGAGRSTKREGSERFEKVRRVLDTSRSLQSPRPGSRNASY